MDERIARTDFKKLEKKQEVYSKSIADKNEQIKPQPIKDKKNSGFSPNQYEKDDLINQLKSTKNESQTNASFSRFDNYSDVSSGKSKYVQKNEDKHVFYGLKRDADSEINNEAKRINIKTQVHKNFYGINDLNAYPNMKKLNFGYIDTTSPIIYKDIGFVEGLSSNLCRNKSKFNSYTNKLGRNSTSFSKQVENPSLSLKKVGNLNNNFILTPSSEISNWWSFRIYSTA
ncbi:hypothetical protein AYI69_g11227 [Smittium culicis]|uniref:Uncharacterized protein n=1 Tax=Smittium culicis TaxID=133412 RepID=A0A1R1X054_9FUNG|nr:hypothetical protein AYI69_g11227 [Smittium culicis]